MLRWYRCQAEELGLAVKACLELRKNRSLVTDFSNLTKKVPLMVKGQVSQVNYCLWRHIKHSERKATAESEALVEKVKMSDEAWLRLESIRQMEISESGVSYLSPKPLDGLQREKAEVPQGNAGTIHEDANLARD